MNRILIIDIETTGFSSSKNHIVEIGIVSLDLDNGDREILFDKVVCEEGMDLEEVESCWIVNNSTLTAEEIIDSGSLNGYHGDIQKIFNDYPLGLTAFNKAFDFRFLASRGFKYKELDCPMLLSKNIVKAVNKNGAIKWPNVQEAFDYFFPSESYIEKHRGADDAFNEAKIVYALYSAGVFKI